MLTDACSKHQTEHIQTGEVRDEKLYRVVLILKMPHTIHLIMLIMKICLLSFKKTEAANLLKI